MKKESSPSPLSKHNNPLIHFFSTHSLIHPLLLFVILTILNTTFVLGVAVSPASISINYQPGQRIEVPIGVKNTMNLDMGFSLRMTGELAEYFEITNSSFDLGPMEDVGLKLIFNTPKNLTPGIHTARLIVTEIRKPQGGSGQVGARGAVIILVKVRVPFDGYYIDAKLLPEDMRVNSTGNIILQVWNYGTKKINTINAELRILDLENNTITTLKTLPYNGLETFEKAELVTTLNTHGFKESAYKVIALINYDNNKKEVGPVGFRIGDIRLTIKNHTKKIFSGRINKYYVLVKNEWNVPVNFDVEFLMFNKSIGNNNDNSNTLIYQTRTPTDTIKPYQLKNITLFVDATGITPNNYTVTLKLNYLSNFFVKNTTLIVVSEEKKKRWNLPIIIIALILLLVLLLVLVFFKRRKIGKS